MSDVQNQVSVAPIGFFTYGAGLGLKTAYPQAAGPRKKTIYIIAAISFLTFQSTIVAAFAENWAPPRLYSSRDWAEIGDLPNASRVAENAPDSQASSLCADRLRAFVVEIDEKMENSHSIYPLEETVRKYFPLYGCNIEEAISIAKTSKHFDLADHSYRDFVIVFRRRIPNGWGFKVIFGLRRDTGDSFLPAALVDITQ